MSLRKNVNQFLKQSSLQRYADELTELVKPSIRIKTHADPSHLDNHVMSCFYQKTHGR